MPDWPQPGSFNIPAEGALLSIPAGKGHQRRVWMTQGAMQRSHAPQRGVFSIYAPDFFLKDPSPWLVPQNPAAPNWIREFSVPDLRQKVSSLLPSASPAEAVNWEEPPLSRFEAVFHDLQRHFRTRRLTKTVPVVFETAYLHSSSLHAAQRIMSLLKAPETLMPYGCWFQQEGMLGASPELLFQIRDGMLTTMALAGTLPTPPPSNMEAIQAAEAAFLADPKERREHCLVIEGILESLAPFGIARVGETKVVKLPTLWHLQTPIEVALREMPDFAFLTRRLHPTPALGGLPRDASLRWLRKQDAAQAPGHCRGRFGAPFGAQYPDGSAFCLVAVRNLMWNADTVRIGAGCGVIQESRMEREWAELRQKRESVKRLFGL